MGPAARTAPHGEAFPTEQIRDRSYVAHYVADSPARPPGRRPVTGTVQDDKADPSSFSGADHARAEMARPGGPVVKHHSPPSGRAVLTEAHNAVTDPEQLGRLVFHLNTFRVAAQRSSWVRFSMGPSRRIVPEVSRPGQTGHQPEEAARERPQIRAGEIGGDGDVQDHQEEVAGVEKVQMLGFLVGSFAENPCGKGERRDGTQDRQGVGDAAQPVSAGRECHDQGDGV